MNNIKIDYKEEAKTIRALLDQAKVEDMIVANKYNDTICIDVQENTLYTGFEIYDLIFTDIIGIDESGKLEDGYASIEQSTVDKLLDFYDKRMRNL